MHPCIRTTALDAVMLDVALAPGSVTSPELPPIRTVAPER